VQISKNIVKKGLSSDFTEEILQYPNFYDFYFFLGFQKIKLLLKSAPGKSAFEAGS
jgi:hypothetical protein